MGGSVMLFFVLSERLPPSPHRLPLRVPARPTSCCGLCAQKGAFQRGLTETSRALGPGEAALVRSEIPTITDPQSTVHCEWDLRQASLTSHSENPEG